ncbi:MAG: hypothetical protein EBS39_13205, partial [Gammaproteobacteria bacterium]|nr:hypothetical protein [Gammaproteobacteria bacterium]
MRPAATAACGSMPKSAMLSSVWKTPVKIVEPPGVPSEATTRPSRTSRVGVIDDSMRLPGAISLARPPTTPYMFGWPGLVLKSSISLLSRKPAPVTTTPLPNRIAGTDMLYSSGTTGLPKGVTRAFVEQPLESSPTSVAPTLGLLFGVTSDSVYLSPAPMYHAAPLRFTMAAQSVGCTAVAMEHFDAEQYLAAVQTHKVTHSQVVPTMFVRMLKLDADIRTKYDVSSLQTVIHAAAPCPIPVKKQMIEWFGPIIHEYYAGTEGNGFVYCNSDMWLAHEGTVGVPISCTI